MSGLHPRLREGTAEAHARLEARLALLDPDLSERRYVAVLRGMRAFYAPLEARLRAAAPRVYDADRARRLDADLRHFGVTDPGGAEVTLPRVHDASDAFGCAYVLEGSSLGGVVIARRLRPRFDGGLRFFTGDGAGVGARWRTFLHRLEQGAGTLDDEQVIRAARETFEALERGLERAGALRG